MHIKYSIVHCFIVFPMIMGSWVRELSDKENEVGYLKNKIK